jgi:hypothetical protein
MNHSRLTPQPALTPDETLASDRLLAELLLELAGDTVVGLDTRRSPAPAAGEAGEVAQRRASA